MSSKKRLTASFMIFILVMFLFTFTAGIEYNRSYQNDAKDAKDQLLLIKLNLENIITSKMLAVNGLKAYVEINPNFSQSDFDYFARGIYESSNNVVKSMAFLTDTTITHIYPFDDNKNIIGTDLDLNAEQKEWIRYAKENQKAIITAPVNLVESGVGIVVRVPVLRQRKYFGQVPIIMFERTPTSKHSVGG